MRSLPEPLSRLWALVRARPLRAAYAAALTLLVLGAVVGFVHFAIGVHALYARRATGPSWSFPSRVFADGVSLEPGRALPEGYLRAHLEARGYRETAAPAAPGEYAGGPAGFEIVLRGFDGASDPDGAGGPERVRLRLAGGRLAALQRLGGLAGHAPPDTARAPRLEPVAVALLADSHRVLRTWVPLERIPRALREAVVAAEDRRFRRHLGLDLRGSFRAVAANVRAGGVREGASTITQQLARGLFLGSQRTWSRKLSEMLLALGLEALLSKDQILEMYLNSVYWGQSGSGGVAGAAEAARWYFDAPVESLSVSQAALLAGIIPAPNAYSPFRNARTALARRNLVLADMVATGAHLGRAVLTRGDHATYDQLVAERPSAGDDPLAFAPAGLAAVPPGTPNVLNRLAVRAFNELWYRKAPSSHLGLESITGFFHPLDMVGDWNRLYGRGGFLQYQFVVPFEAVDTLRTIVATVAASGHASFLAVLKRFGPESGGLLSFPTPGWTLTLDLPAAVAGLGGLVGELDRMVLEAGGRHYLAKDATATPEIIRAGYPRLDEWLQIRRTVDPTGRWISDQARRLDLY